MCVDTKLPQGMPKGFKAVLRRTNMKDIMTKWDDFGLPKVTQFSQIKTLFDIRNAIMHNGKDKRANPKCFKKTAEAVRELLEIV